MSREVTIVDHEVEIIEVGTQGPSGPQGNTGATGAASGPWADDPSSYDTGSVVTRLLGGIIRVFTSEIDDNVGNDPALDDGTNWRLQVTGIPIPVVNKTGGALAKGQAVYISGAEGSRMKVALGDASDPAKDDILAVLCTDLAENASGFATAFGLMYGQDTSAWTEGNVLYLSGVTPGLLTTSKPTSPIHAIEVAHVARSHATQGELLIHVGHDPHQFLLHTGGTKTGGIDTVTEITNGATAALDMDAGRMHVQAGVQTEDVTLSITNAASGKRAGITFTLDGVGGWAINVPGSWIKIGNFTFTTTAGKRNRASVWQEGTDVLYTGGPQP